MKKYVQGISMLLAALLCFPFLSEAQQKGYPVRFILDERGDTLYHINLKEIIVRPYKTLRSQFRSAKDWRQYYRLVYNFRKAYPYALLAKERLRVIDEELRRIPSETVRKQRIKQAEKELFAEFEQPLRKLSVSQGRLLLKLIDREIGQSSFYLIKDLKGGLAATFWQGIARLFGSDLKKQYDKYGEDRDVEELVRIYQEGRFDWLYFQIF